MRNQRNHLWRMKTGIYILVMERKISIMIFVHTHKY